MPCALSAQCDDVFEAVAVLVHIDGNRRGGLERRPALVASRQRLLAVLHAELHELWKRVERLVERPVLVDVDLQRHGGRRADSAHAIDVEPVATAELELEAEKVRRLRGPRGHVVGISQPDRPRRRRACLTETEQSPHRQPHESPLQIVQRGVERGARCELALGKPAFDLVERERIVSEKVCVLLDVRERRLGRLVVLRDRGSLSVAGDVAVRHLDLDDVDGVRRAAGDHEGLRELQRGQPGGHFHRGYTSPRRACSSGDRACASGAQGRRFDSCQAHSPRG